MIGFNIWNWFLAMTGQTSVEFWGRRLDKLDTQGKRFEYSYNSCFTNLKVIFGTRNICKILLFSNIRTLPTNGVEWDHIGVPNFYKND